ncbi:MAG: helix-turn-helix domain-containing protein [Phycisphaeraceae bacterium JB051]
MKQIESQSWFRVRHAVTSEIGSISQAGYLPDSRGIGDPDMRVLGEYAVVFLLAGSGHYADANAVRSAIAPGDLILVFPDLPHRYGPGPDETWTEMYLVFNGPVFSLWDQKGLIDRASPVMHLEPLDYWAKRFESILGAPHEAGHAPPLLEVCRLQEVLAEIFTSSSHADSQHDASDRQWLSHACMLLETDLANRRHPWQVAEHLGMDYERFRKRFTQLMGMPPARFRNNRIIDRACEMMQSTMLSDKQIALSLGFCDEFYFSKRFKQLVGVTPSVFRRRLPRAQG